MPLANEIKAGEELLRKVQEAFSPGGALQRALPGFVPRDSQRGFALEVARTIISRGTLVAEAGTGTGKTFAYLVPALLAGARVLVSTAGKPLQDQLFGRDLPQILRALRLQADCAILKGRSNYICLKRLREVQRLPTREDVAYLRDIRIFAETNAAGDRSELVHIPENDPIWPLVTSTRENCTGQKCPCFKDCFLNKARKRARASDILVVNHHLFLSSLAIGEEGAEELLPAMPVTVIDEAHQLPAIATDFFGSVFSTYSVVDFAREALLLAKTKAPGGARWDELTQAVSLAAKEIPAAAAESLGLEEGDRVRAGEKELGGLSGPLSRLSSKLSQLAAALSENAGRDPDLDLLLPRCAGYMEQADSWNAFIRDGEPRSEDGTAPHVRWLQMGKLGLRLCDTPLSVGDKIRAIREEKGEAWVLTSATLSTAGDFTHFLTELGLEDAKTAAWESPFDFATHAALYIPKGLPSDPRAPGFPQFVAECAWPFVRKAGGRAFFLCTSLKAVEAVADRLESLALEAGVQLRVLRQGSGTRKGLLEQYREEKHAVLVGSMSFWEGIDIKGDALSIVVIDKFPFAPPDDPVVAARREWIEQNGGSPFLDYQVPEMVTALRQGAGRLIRSETDRGVLILCDPRAFDKWHSYGRRVIMSLPGFGRTSNEEVALSFIPEPGSAAAGR
ncbi:ATP-dependent DNA helicase [Mesosutterella sp. AGMB02718]|uniref:ATP-dependent DNA helicase n=1 Tax=Mesosutterella faecium TaxID=2925194 RepID=A0ABT7IKG5_9BURK|nr:ATP-dependent DNA helicase [Mesosutterella sp. AGMB02718]MDL2058413.1 ATP-dependent DNA helicase [Mesosutterella sp. AGMB02718]